METWHNMKDSDTNVFIKLDQYLLRKILGAHSKVPLEFLYLETSAIPVDFVLASRRLNFLHTVLSRSDNEMTKRIYIAQKNYPIKGDWVNQVEEDLVKMGIKMDDLEISLMKKSLFKSMVKRCVRTASFNSLTEIQQTHTKINNIKYVKFRLQRNLNNDNFTTHERSTLFNIRANCVNGFKMCTPSIYRNNTNCKLGCLEDDTINHCMICPVLDNKIGQTSARLNEIFLIPEQQQQSVAIFTRECQLE